MRVRVPPPETPAVSEGNRLDFSVPRTARASAILETAVRMSGLLARAPAMSSSRTGSSKRFHHWESAAMSSGAAAGCYHWAGAVTGRPAFFGDAVAQDERSRANAGAATRTNGIGKDGDMAAVDLTAA